MRILTLLFILAMSSWLLSCKSQHYTKENLPDVQLIFGDGGGFTGATTEFMLLENGQLFKKYSLDQSTTEVGKIKKKEAKELFAEAEAMQFETMDINHPGNMYYFLGLKTETDEHRCTWGAQDYEVSDTLQQFRQKLLHLAQKLTTSK